MLFRRGVRLPRTVVDEFLAAIGEPPLSDSDKI